MKRLSHTTAKASHYDEQADSYDILTQENSNIINKTIAKILKQNEVKSVLDMTCGTGSQVFYLAKKGYEVVGSDINEKMLAIARQKAKEENLDIRFIEGDMRTLQVGTFDAVITIFNAVGHLTKSDFEKTMINIASNLKSGGLYIFDINNLSYLLKDNNITDLTIDRQKKSGDTAVRKMQYSTINKEGILASYTLLFKQEGDSEPEVSESAQTLQVYSAQKLKDMLEKNGFEVIEKYAIDGSPFIEDRSDRILMVAKKV